MTDTLTESFISLAQANGIPVVGVYETMPTPGYNYQSWMLAETKALQQAVTQEVDREALMARHPCRRRPRGRSGLDGIAVRLSGREVLDYVSFTIRPGEFTGLIGSNGAGKTTILPGHPRPAAAVRGPVMSAGQPAHPPLRGASATSRRSCRSSPDMPLRVRDVVALGIDGHRLGFRSPPARRRELVAETLARSARRLRRRQGRASCPAASSSGS